MKKCKECWELSWEYICLCESKSDLVNKPPHYNQWNIEVLDFILDQKMSYLQGNVVKYICRYKFKNWVEDLKKAQFYLNELIDEYEDKQ